MYVLWILIRRNPKMCDLKDTLNLLFCHICRGHFSKHSEGFGKLLLVNILRPTIAFTPGILPKHSECLEKSPRHTWLESPFAIYSSSISFNFVESISATQAQNQDHYQNHFRQHQRTDMNNTISAI